MSWYHIILLTFTMVYSATQAKELMGVAEDAEIVKAILYDEYRSYEKSRQIYAKLFDKTEEEIYLLKEVTSSIKGNTHVSESTQRLLAWDKLHPRSLDVKRLLVPLYLSANKLDLAKIEAEFIVERSSDSMDLELASNPFLYSGEYKRALSLLGKVYEANQKESVLLRMADIMDQYTHETKHAIQMLEMHRRINTYTSDLLVKLLVLYGKERDVDGLQETYKRLYQDTKDEKILSKIMQTYAYSDDMDGAIKFLESQKTGDDLLYELYRNKKLFKRALVVLERLYKKSSDPKMLAEKAVLTFESALDKSDRVVLEDVAALFEQALKAGVDDSIYLNYYGYILVDEMIDVERGISVIQDALEQQPENLYYLDSLAWGYYKSHQCVKSYRIMQGIVKEAGLEVDEIVEHWKMIQECK